MGLSKIIKETKEKASKTLADAQKEFAYRKRAARRRKQGSPLLTDPAPNMLDLVAETTLAAEQAAKVAKGRAKKVKASVSKTLTDAQKEFAYRKRVVRARKELGGNVIDPIPDILDPVAETALFIEEETKKFKKETSKRLENVEKSMKIGKAKKINEEANEILANAAGNLNYSRKMAAHALEELGLEKAHVLDTSMNRFVSSFEKIKSVELEISIGVQEAQKIKMDKMVLGEMKELGDLGTAVISGMGAGAVGGALTAFGAYSAAATFATASTGTAISTLSGVAATNATLAFFGGGSLAAGGFGVAGGTMVLGGIVTVPALIIMGVIIVAKQNKELEKALQNIAIAKKNAKEMAVATEMCQAIKERSRFFTEKLKELDDKFLAVIQKLESLVAEKGNDYMAYEEDDRALVASAVAVAMSVKSIVDTPLLTKKGRLTVESERLQHKL